MSYQRERDEFMVRCQLSPETARALLRHATTLQRLAEAQCNGDWPADNGERKVKPCPLCESQWVPSQIQGGTAARLAYRQQRDIPLGRHGDAALKAAANGREEKACPDCRTEARVHALLEGTQWQAWTQGDPRGYVLRLFPRRVPAGPGKLRVVTHEDMDCGRVSALGVPTR